MKTLTQIMRLQTGIDYLARAANELRDAGEPGLALAVLSIRQKSDFARTEAVVKTETCGTRVYEAS